MNFNPALHEYTENGHVVRSVTQILKDAGIIDDTWYNEEARERGSAVHTLCERYANGERLSRMAVPIADYEYVNAFAAWIKNCGAYPIALECVISGTVNGHRYAGKFDGLYEIMGKRVLVDLKTGAKAKWHRIQLAAYGMGELEDGMRLNPDKAMVLYLHADGLYKADFLTGSDLIKGISEFKEAISA